MRYCVVENTTKVIDGSDNSTEMMIQNALNSGFTEGKIEILTESEYLSRKKLEPRVPKTLTQIELVKLSQVEQFETILEILGGM